VSKAETLTGCLFTTGGAMRLQPRGIDSDSQRQPLCLKLECVACSKEASDRSTGMSCLPGLFLG
jgi:hypothetical protein